MTSVLACGRTELDDAPASRASFAPDAGTPSPDAGSMSPDAGTLRRDAGTTPPDAGTPTPLSPFMADWPRILVGVESRQFSSFDRTGGNDDGFSGTFSELYVDDRGEHVIFDALGPGRLNTLWFTSAVSGTAPLGLGRLRFYLDDATQPTFTVDADQLFTGAVDGFPRTLVFDNRTSTGGFVSYVPIAFARRLRITTEQRAAFYSAQYETFPPDALVTSWSPAAPLDARAKALGATGDDGGGDGVEVGLDRVLTGAGLVSRLTFLPAGKPTAAELRAARVRIWWEDETEPGVDCPVDAFVGSGLGEAPVASVAFTMTPGRWVNHMPMPYWRRARFQITGLGGRLFLRIADNPLDEARSAHLRVSWRLETLDAGTDDFVVAGFTGAGRLVATVLTVEPPDPARDKQWWEGDLRSYTDFRRTPGIQGTGYEDDHFGGWSNEFFATPFSLPLHGEPRAEILDKNGQWNGNVTMYRIWPGIPFLGEIHHSVEHGSENNRSVVESAAAFFYAELDGWLSDTSFIDLGSERSRLDHHVVGAHPEDWVTSTTAFEGRDYGLQFDLGHAPLAEALSFDLEILPVNEGVYLRRVYDQATGGQRATVDVDGTRVGTWYTVEANTTLSAAERDFFIPGALTRGKSSLRVTVTPLAPGGFDASEFRALCVVPPTPSN